MKINCSLLALAIDALGIGTTKFSPMGLSPATACGVDVLIPAAGILTSAYAVDAMVGAPLMTLLPSHRARHSALIFLMAIFALGDVLSATAPDYMTPMLSCILISLNHGASFGLGSVVAASVVPKHKQASTVATMPMGLIPTNIDGVPAVTWLGEAIGWRTSLLAVAGLGVISMVSLFLSLPKGGAGARSEVEKELAVLMRPQALSASLTTVLGAGAMFTFYIYISPVLQSITHATPVFVATTLVLIGVGFSIGNHLGDKLADRSVNGTLKGFSLLLMVTIPAIPFPVRDEFGVTVSIVVRGVATFAVAPPLQMRVMRIASEAPGLSSSVSIGAFNLGNVLGTAAGGAVISAGLGYSFMPAMGAIVAGLASLLAFMPARKRPEIVCVANS